MLNDQGQEQNQAPSGDEAGTLTKAQLAELLFDRVGFNKREAKQFIDGFFDELVAQLAQGNDIKITGFGNFNIRMKAPRPGRNPRTGELVPIDARHVVTFHASQKLKSSVQEGCE